MAVNTIINIRIGDRNINVYVYKKRDATLNTMVAEMGNVNSVIHRHKYVEIHIALQGEAHYLIGEKEFDAKVGQAVIIPPKHYHTVRMASKDYKMIGFQADFECYEGKIVSLSQHVFEDFAQLMLVEKDICNIDKVIPYIYWFINESISNEALTVKENTEYAYLIFEYMSRHYNEDIKLCDISKEVHISEKQLQRILKKETGRTFLAELTSYRMKVAEYLIKNTDKNLNEIAKNVGYSSYSGFWKAWQKYKKEKS